MPELPGTALLDGVRKEVERNALRARNGVKWAVGAEWAPRHPTDYDIVWEDGKAQLRHYRNDTPPRLRTPVIALLGLVGQPYVFDLYKGGSVVQMLMDHGFDVYIMDWGVADAQDAANTLETYLQGYFPRALRAACAESGVDAVNCMAYCMGGCMALHALAAQPDLPIHALVTLASPFDFSKLGPLIDALRLGKINPADVIDDDGLLPASVVLQSFKSRKPTSDLVNYVNLWQNLWNDQYMEGYQAIGRFLSDHIPLPGALFEQVTRQWLRDNGFVNDKLRLGGRRASLGNVHNPVLAVIAERDDICVESATAVIADVLTGTKTELLRVDAGHASLFSGRKAVKAVMPRIFDWLEGQSEVIA
jgi:polyhydroxyalkanoate synthase subunit PhaC